VREKMKAGKKAIVLEKTGDYRGLVAKKASRGRMKRQINKWSHISSRES